MNQMRLQCERLIYKVMEILDDPKNNGGESPNVEFWIKQFSKMNDKQFEEFITRPLCIIYQTSGLKREPTMLNINHGLDLIGVPLLEEVYMPYKYKDQNGRPVKSKKCIVAYIHMKRMKQLLTKKNGMSIEAKMRDMRTGLLSSQDKHGRSSDREMESFAISGLTNSLTEFSRPRAASMQDKNQMNSIIKTMGQVRLSDLKEDPVDDLSKNLLSVYLLGAGLYSNLVNIDYMTPYTLKNKDLRVQHT